MLIVYRPEGIENFHNCPPLRLRVSGEVCINGGREVYVISKHQALRAGKHFCGIPECECPQGGIRRIAGSLTEWGVPVEYCE